MRIKSLAFGVTILMLSGCGPGKPHALCVELEGVASSAAAVVNERAEALRNALADLESLSSLPTGDACAVARPRFEPNRVFGPNEIAGALSSSLLELASAEGDVALFRDTCGQGDLISQERLVQKHRDAIAALPTQHDLIVLERERIDPTMQGTSQFTPGSLSVTGLVYSHADQRVVCLAHASVTNREQVMTDRSRRNIDYLQLDLNRNAIEAVRTTLKSLPAS